MIQSQPVEWKISIMEGMEANTIQENFYNRVVRKISQAFQQWKRSVLSVCRRIRQVGADDPRRIIHSIKVGVALSLVSLIYFVRPLFDGFGENAIWAVMTVVVVFEFTVGATLSKGLNRSFATLLAGLLGVGVSYVAELTGKNCERFILGFSVFTLGAASTYSRFFPVIKQRYDYGVVIFILTFSLIAISGYRTENLFQMMHQRIATIVIGCALCFLINIFPFPIWAGDDLHSSVIHNIEGLAESLQECVTKYFMETEGQESEEDKVGRGYKCVLNSKATQESLANFARWEPPHGRFFFRYPWKLYVKVGGMTRYCAYCVEALNGLLNSEIQTPRAGRKSLKMPCIDIGRESVNVLRELADSIRTRRSRNSTIMIDRLAAMVENLQNSLRSQPELFINTKRWRTVEEKPLCTSPLGHFQEGLIRSDKFHDSSIPKTTEEADEENTMPFRTILEEEMQEVVSRNRAIKICKMSEMKRSRYEFMEVLPLASFIALLIETVARLESVIAAVEKLGEEAKFINTDQQKKEAPPSIIS